MNLEQLASQLETGPLGSVYALAGSEALLREDGFALLREAVLGGAAPDFDLQSIRAAENRAAAALRDAVRTLPVLAPRRLVHLVYSEGRAPAGAAELASGLAEVVVELSAQPEVRVVLVVSLGKPDRRLRWVKLLGKAGTLVDCEPPRSGRPLESFVKQEAKRQAVTLGSGAAALLAERIGPQLLLLRQEIAKAALLAGAEAVVTRECVDASAGAVVEKPVWDLTDAIGAGRGSEALELLVRMQRGGAPAPMVLGALAAHFRKLARLSSGGSVAGPPFALRKLESQARRYSTRRLVACLEAIHETDTAIKGAGALPPGLALERLVLGLSS